MKKHLFWLVALALSIAACTDEPTDKIGGNEDNNGQTEQAEVTQLLKLNADNSRILLPTRAEEGSNGGWIEGPSHLKTGNEDYNLQHVYSATGIAVDGTTVYISWHSNRAQDLDEDSEEHDHGTNVDGTEPSLETADDWGGMIDVLDFSNGIDGATFAGSYWQPEHKYNHVCFADNYLYLASTSWFVGAAIHRVPVEGTTLSTTDAQRFNLTGNSANCVVKLGTDVITVSGRTKGGVNWFNDAEIDAAFDLTNKDSRNVYDLTPANINTEVDGFGGKHIWNDNGTIYVLRNPEAPVVEVYTSAGVSSSFNLAADVKLSPIDGKNVITGDEDYIYVCCGQYGLHIYDKDTHAEVATSHKNTADNKNATPSQKYYAANGVDFDANYIYVANGSGLVIFEKNFENLNANNGLKVKKNAQFTGTIDFGGLSDKANDKTADGLVKESSNFVKLVDVNDKHYAFVAYGMYGLRIYDLAELYPATEE